LVIQIASSSNPGGYRLKMVQKPSR